jgi:trehalose-phosphatase
MSATVAKDCAWVSEVSAAYRAGRPLALLFDYDGTLTPIVRHPSLARLPTRNRTRLTGLAALPNVAVGVISGRALGEVREFVGLAGLYYAGSGGLEMDFRGRRVEYPGATAFRRAAAAVTADLGPVVARFPGTWVEAKPVALALHFRGLPPTAAARFRAETAAVMDRHAAVRYREVSAAVEVTPAGGWDKGTAVEWVLGRYAADVFPVYAGDAANDAEAMAVVGVSGGVAIGVGPDAPAAATHRVASSDEFEGSLDRLLQELYRARGLSVPEAAPEVVESAGGPALVEAVAADGPEILLVDSDAAFRTAFADALRRAGWRVWEAAGPADAVEAVARHPDLRAAVVDLQLPGFQGGRVLAELGRRAPGLVRCGMSAEVTPYTAAAFRRLSDITLFAKPFDFPAAAAALRAMVGAAPVPGR